MRIILFLCLLPFLCGAEFCYFNPPAGWEIAQLKVPSPHVKIGFIGKGSTEFRPSINLATEEIDVPLKGYIKAVKELHKADPAIQWRDLGKFAMKGGAGHLTEMTNNSPWGDIKILQAFLVQNGTAYILTGAVLKEDFAKFQNELLAAFRSLTITSDLLSLIGDEQQREEFRSLFSSVGTEQSWKKLQAQIESFQELGPYWQFLALQEGHTLHKRTP